MEIRVCNRCKSTNIKTLVPNLKNLFPNAEIIIGCQNMCGIGSTKSFAIVDHIPIIADNEQELLKKIKETNK